MEGLTTTYYRPEYIIRFVYHTQTFNNEQVDLAGDTQASCHLRKSCGQADFMKDCAISVTPAYRRDLCMIHSYTTSDVVLICHKAI